ncbi:hypothetical protein [Halobacterium rubrum]|uniref:hypothetical protein n=1 Tax=Halobacterium TaxID=2239 RepID=UPI001F30AF7A|nr:MULTISPECIES: hypothetical protein [Halobacterium]MDH5020599.1 hypothetical protein [Halobacterium rubrum]
MDTATVTRAARRATLIGVFALVVGSLGVLLDGTLMCSGTGCDGASVWEAVAGAGLFTALGGAAVAGIGALVGWVTRPR